MAQVLPLPPRAPPPPRLSPRTARSKYKTYISPDGRRFRSLAKVRRYVDEHQRSLSTPVRPFGAGGGRPGATPGSEPRRALQDAMVHAHAHTHALCRAALRR